jgi:low affinity Fe/Cu permease
MEAQDVRFGAWFGHLATKVAGWVGSPIAFVLAILVVVMWGATGPRFHYSDTWQLVINTGTTIVTFLMVFLIQNTQNRDARAIHLKLDEVIRAMRGAHNEMIDIEKLSDQELGELSAQYERIREHLQQRKETRRDR